MKGIILAGGMGTRLYPATSVVCKQLLPVYDKPMIYYPLSTLILAGIRDILIISTPQDLVHFQKLFQDGSSLGIRLRYQVQEKPRGIAEAFLIGEDFIEEKPVCLILGDNIFYGSQLSQHLNAAKHKVQNEMGAMLFACSVKDPWRYGVVSLNEKGQACALEEKPTHPQSNYAVTGLYFYDSKVVSLVKTLKPSDRGELEITDLNKKYLECHQLSVTLLGRGYAWLDAGTPESLLEAALFVKVLEERQGLKISCPEEIAYQVGFLKKENFKRQVDRYAKSPYKKYLETILHELEKK